MLEGIAPIIIFQFSKKTAASAAESVSKIPIVSSIVNTIGLPPIPLYLDEKLTGIIVDSEDKNIDIETSQDSLSDGGSPLISQKSIESVVKINLKGSRDSIGLTILSAVADMILPKVTSQEYSIAYLNGPTTMFNAKLKSFQVNSNTENTLLNISIELIKGDNKTQADKTVPQTERFTEAVPLQSGVPPTAPNVPPVTGPSAIPTKPLPTQAPVRVNLG